MSDSLNKTLLKKFAVEARNELREKVALKASIYGITLELSDKDRKTKGEEGFLKNEDTIVSSLVPKEKCQAVESDYFVERTFEGSLPGFIAAFLGGKTISEQEAEEIKRMIDEHKEG